MPSAIEPFINCKSGEEGSQSTTIAYQLNKASDVERNMWYWAGADFKTNEWSVGRDVTVEDGPLMNSARATDNVTSFKESLEDTIASDTSSTFLKRCYYESLQGAEHFKEFLDYGINVKTVTNFADGTSCIKEYNCCTVTDPGALLEQAQNADAENAFNLTLNKDPKVTNMGVSNVLPKGITDVDAVVDAKEDGLKVEVTISSVIDNPDNPLIYPVDNKDKTWWAALFDASTRMMVSEGYTSGIDTEDPKEPQAPSTPISLTAPKAGKYVLIVAYAFYQRGNTIDYNTNVVKTLDLRASGKSVKKIKASTPENEVEIIKNKLEKEEK